MENIDRILANCIDDIQTGKSDLENCLARYPEHRQRLEPLLRLAAAIERPHLPSPDPRWKTATRSLLVEDAAARKKGFFSSFRLGHLQTAIIAAVVFLMVSTTGTVYASQSALPGETLYPVKTSWERVRLELTFSTQSRFDLSLTLAAERLEEIGHLPQISSGLITDTLSRYRWYIDEAFDLASRGDSAGLLQERFCLELQDQLKDVYALIDSSADPLRSQLRQVNDYQFQQQIDGITLLASVDPLAATTVNLAAMQYALQRAQIAAANGNNAEVDTALTRYGQLGQLGKNIGHGAGNTAADIERINMAAANSQLSALAKIYGQAPAETRTLIETAMAGTINGYVNAVQNLQAEGKLGDLPSQPEIPHDIPEDVRQRLQPGTTEQPPSGGDNSGNQGGPAPGGSTGGPGS